jgi:4-alpha-glucanotransferase
VPEYSAGLSRAAHVYLAKSPTALVTVQIEDMIGMLEPVNVPGTSSEYSNWTRRVSLSAREVFARSDVRELCATLVASRKITDHE